MDLAPQKFREIVFQLLFSLDMGSEQEATLIPFVMGELKVTKKYVREAFKKSNLIWQSKELLDQEISKRSKEYALERIKTVEKNVLRLALYELLIEKELNTKIILSEAHRITRKFGTKEGAAYVNALLDDSEPKDEQAATLSTPEEEAS